MIHPKLTVIISVRNAVSTIARALDSLIAQHYPNLEVIVCDGLSDDGTIQVLQQYAHIITRMKSEKDKGGADGYNKAIKLATGDFIGFLSADDVYEPGALWAVADAITRQSDTEVITFGMIYRKNNIVSGIYTHERQLAINLNAILIDNQTFQLSRFYKPQLLREIGDFNCDQSLWYISCDREWMTRLALRGCKNAIIPKALYGFTVHSGSISNNPANHSRIIDEHIMIADMLPRIYRLNARQLRIIENWRLHQLAFGFWKGLAAKKFIKAVSFAKQGLSSGKFYFPMLCAYLLIQRTLKRFFLKISNRIDTGYIPQSN